MCLGSWSCWKTRSSRRIRSVQRVSIDAASTVFEGLRSLSHLDIKVCSKHEFSLKVSFGSGVHGDTTAVGIKKTLGHNLHWRRVVNISNTSNLMKFNIWCKICFTDTTSFPPVSLQHKRHFYTHVFMCWSSNNSVN